MIVPRPRRSPPPITGGSSVSGSVIFRSSWWCSRGSAIVFSVGVPHLAAVILLRFSMITPLNLSAIFATGTRSGNRSGISACASFGGLRRRFILFLFSVVDAEGLAPVQLRFSIQRQSVTQVLHQIRSSLLLFPNVLGAKIPGSPSLGFAGSLFINLLFSNRLELRLTDVMVLRTSTSTVIS